MYLWLKALHLIFVVCWFAGLFYLPRLFVNHAMTDDRTTRQLLAQMERKLYRFMTGLAVLAVAFGLWLMLVYWEMYEQAYWLHAKLTLVALLVVYHGFCGYYVGIFRREGNHRSHVFFRWFNELPVLALFAVVILAVVKPF